MTRLEELRNDLENLIFTCRYYIGVLAELEQLGRTHTPQFKQTEKNVNTLKHNIKRIEQEIEREELNEIDERYYSACTFW